MLQFFVSNLEIEGRYSQAKEFFGRSKLVVEIVHRVDGHHLRKHYKGTNDSSATWSIKNRVKIQIR